MVQTVHFFQKGDAVYYAGSISRQGTNCEFHLVDERIVGRNHSTSLSTSFPGINVIATASRSESVEWCKKMGADYVINHHKNIKSQINEIIGIDYADYILCLNNTDGHFDSMKQLVAPPGKICSIVETNKSYILAVKILNFS